jgi:putative intracellular protease/amidase
MADSLAGGWDSSMIVPNILMALPDHDFDPTESAIPWQACHNQGWNVTFSTENGAVAECDLNRLNGPLPGLLGASKKARDAYSEMRHDQAYLHPLPYAEIDPGQYHGLLLPGGDGLRVRQYLDSTVLQGKLLQFYLLGKLIGAICHGVLLLARTIDPKTGHSVLFGRKVTAPPRWLDRFAYQLDKWLLKRGYIMYSSCVEDEVRACLEQPADLSTGRSFFTPYVVTDGNLITSRWYLDAELFGENFIKSMKPRILTPASRQTHLAG